MSDDIFNGYGVEIELNDPQKFNIIRETISRIGYAQRNSNTLYQSCHIFHKQGRYAIMHFKEMFAFDGKPSEISESDIARRNTIVSLLEQWGMIKLVKPLEGKCASLGKIMIVPWKDKANWTFVQKYTIGGK